MREPIYERRGKTIIRLEDGHQEQHDSINAAKRASRDIQLKTDGALGIGSLRAVRTKPKARNQRINSKRKHNNG